ncbi:Ig-like domain-containing protein [Alcaligenes sp. WGS1538]|uniref:Ig-like domain-containing protein n=1 Tax=Alcaligenes sp. WGS1538 TaxID=3366811 RepID=UPI00372D770A
MTQRRRPVPVAFKHKKNQIFAARSSLLALETRTLFDGAMAPTAEHTLDADKGNTNGPSPSSEAVEPTALTAGNKSADGAAGPRIPGPGLPGSGGATDYDDGDNQASLLPGDNQGRNVPVAVDEGGFIVIDSGNLSAYDPDSPAEQVQYTITVEPAQGRVYYQTTPNGPVTYLGVGSTFTQEDVNQGRIHYMHSGAETSASQTGPTDKFTFTLSDGATEILDNEFHIYVLPTNDAPTITAPDGPIRIIDPNGATPIPDVSIGDKDQDGGGQLVDDFVQVVVRLQNGNGSLNVDYNGVTIAVGASYSGLLMPGKPDGNGTYLMLQGKLAEVNAALSSLSINFSNDRNAIYHLEIIADDRLRNSAGALTGGANGGGQNQAEDGSQSSFPVDPTDYDWSRDTVPTESGNLSAKTIVLWASRDNDLPVFTLPWADAIYEDVGYEFSRAKGNRITIADEESSAFGSPMRLTLTISNGTLSFKDTTGVRVIEDGGGRYVFEGSVAQLEAMLDHGYTLKASADHHGESSVVLSASLQEDNGGLDAGVSTNIASAEGPLPIIPVNDKPTIDIGNKVDLGGNDFVPLAITGVSDASDAQGADTEHTLKARVVVRFTDPQGHIVTESDGGPIQFRLGADDATMRDGYFEMFGTIAEINDALARLQARFSGDANATYSLQVIVDDRNYSTDGTLSGGANGGAWNPDPDSPTGVSPVDGTTTWDATTASGGLPALYNIALAAKDVNVSGINDAPYPVYVDTLIATEDTLSTLKTAAGTPLSISDADDFGSDFTVALSVYSGALSFPSTTGSGVMVTENGSGGLILVGNLTNINALLETLQYQPLADMHSGTGGPAGKVPIYVAVTDTPLPGSGPAHETVGYFEILIIPQNDRPTINKDVNLGPAHEDDSLSVSVIKDLDFGYSDARDDQSANWGGNTATDFSYIAIVGSQGYDPRQGQWQINDGNGWITIPAAGLSDNAALVFRSSAQIRFTPAADYHGEPGKLVIRAGDQSATHTSSANAAATQSLILGQTSSWSDEKQTIGVTVTGANDSPVIDDNGILPAGTEDVTNSNGSLVSDLIQGYDDSRDNQSGIPGGADNAGVLGGVAIVGLEGYDAAQGTWEYSVDDGTTWNAIGGSTSAASAIVLDTAARVRFVPSANFNGDVSGKLVLRASDKPVAGRTGVHDISAEIGAANSQWSNEGKITTSIAAVNDAPTLTGLPAQEGYTEEFYEGAPAYIISLYADVTVNDVDLGSTPGLGSTIFGAGTITVTIRGYLAGDTLIAQTNPGVADINQNGNTLVITLNDSATLAQVKQAIESIKFYSTSHNSTDFQSHGERYFDLVLNDGKNQHGGSNAGSGTSLDSNMLTAYVFILPTNDAPAIDGVANTVTWTESEGNAGAPVRILPDIIVTDADNRRLDRVELDLSNFAYGSVEQFIFDGRQISLSGDSQLTVGEFTITVTVNETNAKVVISTTDGQGRSPGEFQNLLRGIEYNLDMQDPEAQLDGMDRSVTITVYDRGNLDADPDRQESASTVFILKVVPTNDAPTLTNGSGALGAIEFENVARPLAPGITLEDRELESRDDWQGATLTLGRTQPSSDDVFGFVPGITLDGSAIKIGDKTVGMLDASTPGQWTIIFAAGATSAEVNQLARAITYRNINAAPGSLDYSSYAINWTLNDRNGETDGQAQGQGGAKTAIWSQTLNFNRPPLAQTDANEVRPGATVGANVLTGKDGQGVDSDRDTDALAVTGVIAGAANDIGGVGSANVGSALTGAYGTLTLNADGSYTYIANDDATLRALKVGENVQDVFSYSISDGKGGVDYTTLTITIQGQNDAPAATPDGHAVAAGGTVGSNVIAGNDGAGRDTDPDGDALTVTGVTAGIVSDIGGVGSANVGSALTGLYGTLTLNADGSYTYAADQGAAARLPQGAIATDTFTYAISDGEGGTAYATLTITVTGVNDAPVVLTPLPPSAGLDNAPLAPIDTSVGFTDIDGDALTYTAAGLPSGLSIDPATGIISGTPDRSASQGGTGGVYTVTITASDGKGGSASQIVEITIANPAPATAPDNNAVNAGGTVGSNVIAGNDGAGRDTDPDGDELIVTGVTAGIVSDIDGVGSANVGSALTGAYGTLTLNADGSYTYAADQEAAARLPQGAIATDTFTYAISDGEGGTAYATLTITVTGVNDAPVVLTPLPPSAGLDNAPLAPIDTSVGFTDIDGDALTYTAAGLPSGLSIDPATGIISGTPDRSASQGGTGGVYTVTITASDGKGGSASQIVEITIANPAPATAPDNNAVNAGGTVGSNVIAGNDGAGRDTDPDGDELIVTGVTAGIVSDIDGVGSANVGSALTGAYGTLTLNADGSYTYAADQEAAARLPQGAIATDTFTYAISDGEGGTAYATLTITVTGVNDAPVVLTPLPPSAGLDNAPLAPIDTSVGFTDIDGDALTYTAAGLPSGLSIDPATGIISGTPDRSASQGGTGGVYTVTITASDGKGGSASQTVEITITNPAPAAAPDSNAVNAGGTVGSNVIAGNGGAGRDTDPDGDELIVTGVTAGIVNDIGGVGSANVGSALTGLYGTLTLNADGSYTYAADQGAAARLPQGAIATDTFTYAISDGEGGTAYATLTITVTGVNDAPVVLTPLPPSAGLDNAPLAPIDTSVGFTDIDGDALTYTAAGLPSGLSIDPATGIISGTPDRSASQGGTGGVYTVTITASDGKGGSASQIVEITIANPAPATAPDNNAVNAGGTVGSNVIAGNDGAGRDTDPDGDELIVTGVTAGIVSDIDGVGSANVGSALTGAYGTLTLNADGSYTYAADQEAAARLPQGAIATDTFTYAISDGEGGTAYATLTITVTGVNDAPVVLTPLPPSAGLDNAPLAPIDTSVGFTDIDGDALTYTAAGLPSGLSIDPATGIISGTPDRNASQGGTGGVYKVTITASDGKGGSASQTVEITIANPTPAAAPDSNAVNAGGTVGSNVIAGNGGAGRDTDPDGDELIVTGVTAGIVSDIGGVGSANVGSALTGAYGTLTLNADGSYTYAADQEAAARLPQGAIATDTFTYAISDGQGGAAYATLTITVTGTLRTETQLPQPEPPAIRDVPPMVEHSIPGEAGLHDHRLASHPSTDMVNLGIPLHPIMYVGAAVQAAQMERELQDVLTRAGSPARYGLDSFAMPAAPLHLGPDPVPYVSQAIAQAQAEQVKRSLAANNQSAQIHLQGHPASLATAPETLRMHSLAGQDAEVAPAAPSSQDGQDAPPQSPDAAPQQTGAESFSRQLLRHTLPDPNDRNQIESGSGTTSAPHSN